MLCEVRLGCVRLREQKCEIMLLDLHTYIRITLKYCFVHIFFNFIDNVYSIDIKNLYKN